MGRWSTSCVVMLAFGPVSACNPADRAEQAVEEIDSGNVAACAQERSTIQLALEAYTMLKPDSPVSEAAMVADGYIRQESVLMDIAPDGRVVAAPGTVCT
ncbi:MAG: hypothetical protein ABI894_01930 [Ilumatobacteraceae bacterium]